MTEREYLHLFLSGYVAGIAGRELPPQTWHYMDPRWRPWQDGWCQGFQHLLDTISRAYPYK